MHRPVVQFETRRRATDEQLALLREVELARASRVRTTATPRRIPGRVALPPRVRRRAA